MFENVIYFHNITCEFQKGLFHHDDTVYTIVEVAEELDETGTHVVVLEKSPQNSRLDETELKTNDSTQFVENPRKCCFYSFVVLNIERCLSILFTNRFAANHKTFKRPDI